MNMDGDTSFITVMKTGAYRVKGQMNEQNMASLMEGTPVVIRSRTDDSLSWRGTVSRIDRENPVMGNSSYPVSSSDGSSAAASSSYPFYVELESGGGTYAGASTSM